MYVRVFKGKSFSAKGIGRITLENLVGNQGAFSEVWKGVRKTDYGEHPVAVKFLSLSNYGNEELFKKDKARFKREVETLQYFCSLRKPSFPSFCKCGTHKGLPYYVMEWLEPVNLESLDADDKRFKYIDDVCSGLKIIHDAGYVHYDIKPANIMVRSDVDGGWSEYVLVDFGSAHKVETVESPQSRHDRTVSMLSNGKRVYPCTPGYADPLEDRHTVNADIYALGQVIRDTFLEEVPPAWSRIIDRCTSRNRAYRYQNVDSILADLGNLKGSAYTFAVSDDMHIWSAQKRVVEEEPTEMSWSELRWKLAFGGSSPYERADSATFCSKSTPISEIFIDFGKLEKRNILVRDKIHMTESAILVVRGNGRISVDLDGLGGSDGDNFSRSEEIGWNEPIYPFVILLDGASLDNRTTLGNESAQIMYMVGRYCLLNFSKREASLNAEDPQFILTGRAGYSFVRNGLQNWEKGLYGILREGTTRLFAQQKWDELDIPALLKALRQIRRSDAQGDVQKWLENNISNILMRNLGRYNF